MVLDLTEADRAALAGVLREAIERDRDPLSPTTAWVSIGRKRRR